MRWLAPPGRLRSVSTFPVQVLACPVSGHYAGQEWRPGTLNLAAGRPRFAWTAQRHDCRQAVICRPCAGHVRSLCWQQRGWCVCPMCDCSVPRLMARSQPHRTIPPRLHIAWTGTWQSCTTEQRAVGCAVCSAWPLASDRRHHPGTQQARPTTYHLWLDSSGARLLAICHLPGHVPIIFAAYAGWSGESEEYCVGLNGLATQDEGL
jgi:hypothetical protein